jgi:phytoene synthase
MAGTASRAESENSAPALNMRVLDHFRPKIRRKVHSATQLAAAYAVCRSISRAAARNFYYAFVVLPPEKRDAICAVYAFMRHADDISDDPALDTPEKRVKLAEWLGRLQRVNAGEATDDPVLLALSDAQQCYQIPFELLEKLVAGTAMDVQDPDQPAVDAAPAAATTEQEDTGPTAAATNASGTPESLAGESPTDGPVAVINPPRPAAPYATFNDLYQYCYHVASIVGLICIRIFGYRNPAAEALAEQCGVAFQLTNIIRDVKEDAAMGRVYLPQQDLSRFGRSPEELLGAVASKALPAKFRGILEFEAGRARQLYRSADELLPLIDEDSRPALWVLVTIYRKLLEKIAARNYDVFSEKVRLTMLEKLRVLARGAWLRLI